MCCFLQFHFIFSPFYVFSYRFPFSSYWPPKNLFPVVDVRKESLALKDHPKMQIWEIVLLQYHQNCDILFQNINSISQLSNLFWHLNSWYYSLKELWFTIDAPGAIFAISSIDSWQFLQYFDLWHFWQFSNALGSQNTLGFQKNLGSWMLTLSHQRQSETIAISYIQTQPFWKTSNQDMLTHLKILEIFYWNMNTFNSSQFQHIQILQKLSYFL